jgi:Tfp pilus assembly protein FimT
MVELLLVLALIATISVIAVSSLTSSKESYAPDEEAAQAVSFFREAYHRALSQRQTQRITIDRNQNLILLMDEGRLPGGDEVEVIRGVISNQVSIEQPTVQGAAIAPPKAPYNFQAAQFNSGRWTARFRADGSVVDAAGNPLSATLFYVPNDIGRSGTALIRAVTIYGPTATVRMWKYDAETKEFQAGGN